MSIKFRCPHCQKPLLVKPELVGKRGQCPACKNALTVPAPTAQPADVEAFAAAALADEPKQEAPVKEPTFVEFTCRYCDSKVRVDAELAGKRTPCPECRRIVQVPFLEKQSLKDWRKVDPRMPAGARRDAEPAPEGTWDARSVGAVSRESLVEAGAIVQVKERLTWQQWVKRGAAAAVALGVVGLVSWLVLNVLAQNRQARAVAKALQGLEGQVNADTAAEVHRAAGEYYLRANNAEKARNHFQKSRAAALPLDDSRLTERDCVLTDLAESQVDLGGERPETDKGMRIKWDDAHTEIRQTLQNLHSPEGRREALRRVTRKLIEKGQGKRALSLAGQFADERAELLGIVGLEMLRANEDPKAIEQLASQAQPAVVHSPISPTPPVVVKPAVNPAKPAPSQPVLKPGAEKPRTPTPPSSLIALSLALGNADKAKALAPPPAEGKASAPSALLGYALGMAWQGNWKLAQQIASNNAEPPEDRLAALVAVAEVAGDNASRFEGKGPPVEEVIRSSLEQALQLWEGDLKGKETSPWLLGQLVRVGVRAGMADKVEPVARAIPDAALRGRAQLELLRHRLEATQEQAEAGWSEMVDKNTPAHGLAVEEIARHNARLGAGDAVQKMVDDSLAEPLRPYGYIGLALGLQERDRR